MLPSVCITALNWPNNPTPSLPAIWIKSANLLPGNISKNANKIINKTIELNEGSLGFTYCQIPVVYKNSALQGVKIFYTDGSVKEIKALILDESTSKLVFERTGTVAKIEVSVRK